MSYADRVDRDLEERDRDLWRAHERGEHTNRDRWDMPATAFSEPDCNRCQRGMREAANVEGEPTRNGAVGS